MNFTKRFYVDDLPASFHEEPRNPRWCYFDGGAKTVNSTTSNSPPAFQQPFLQDYMQQASNQFHSGTGQGIFPNSTVVPLSGQTQQALGLQEQRALAGSPLVQTAQANTQAALSGQLSPAARAMIEQVQGTVRPGIDSQFAAAGRYGSGAHAAALSDAIARQAVPLAYQDFQSAMQSAVPLAQQDYFDIGQLANVGQAKEAQAGAELQDQIQKFYQRQNAPVSALQRYAALTSGGNVGGTATTQQPIYSNPMMTAAGLGLGGVSAAGSLFGQGGIFPGGKGFNSTFGF